MEKPMIVLFVDNSNIFISAKEEAHKREGRAARDQIRMDFENMLKLAVADRKLANAFVVGSIPPEERAIWDRLEKATGVKPELYERGSISGGEQGLDQCLQVHMLRAISDYKEPQIVVLMTGDGAGYDDGVGFHADMARMHEAGWGIEVVTWRSHCKKSLREWATAKGCFIPMDDYYESVTFLEGTRRATPIDLSKRAMAAPRLSPAQVAIERAKTLHEAEVRSLKHELEAIKGKNKTKEIGKAKYLKRMARGRK